MKNTPLLEAVKGILDNSLQPISVPEILILLKLSSLSPNKTTLYRMLQKLKEQKYLEEILLDNKTAYFEKRTHHHHHFTCQSCEKIKCIEAPELEKQIHQLEKKLTAQGLSISDHNFYISGFCQTCTA